MRRTASVVLVIPAMALVAVLDEGSGQRNRMSHQLFMSHEGSSVKVNGMQVGSLRGHSIGMNSRQFEGGARQ